MMQKKADRSQNNRILMGLISCVVASAAWGQCEPGWSEVFSPRFMSGGYKASATVFDDGSGPRLVVSDLDRFGDEVGGLQVWDGSAWSTLALPSEVTGGTQIVRAYNDHVPPRMILADIDFNDLLEVYVYEEGTWQAMGFPDGGSGFWWAGGMTTGFDPASDEVFVSGLFYQGGGKSSLVYRFDGESWAPIDTDSGGASATTLVWFDDGSGRKLYAGVRNKIDGMAVAGVARWDGTAWEEVGGGCPASWPSLEVHDDGSGPALWALDNEGLLLAKWDGAAWTEHPLDPEAQGTAFRLISLSVGGAEELYWSEGLSNDSRLWHWDGVDGELVTQTAGGHLWDLTADPTGTLGEGFFAVGNFLQAGETDATCAARWDGSAWYALANTEVGNGAWAPREILATDHREGPLLGKRVYVATQIAGGEDARGIAAWDGTQWDFIGPDAPENYGVRALALGDLGEGNRLYAAGTMEEVVAWDGQTWAVVGEHVQYGGVLELAFGQIAGGEPTLYVGGYFNDIGGEAFNAVAGLTADGWVNLGGGLPNAHDTNTVEALVLHDDGSGMMLFAGGGLQNSNDPELDRAVVRWDGAAWTRIGQTLDAHDARVLALCSADLGDGRKLYAGGRFSGHGDDLNNVGVWNGSEWLPLGDGLSFDVGSLTAIDTREGMRLAATSETFTDGDVAERVYVWDGTRWTPFGAEADGNIRSIVQTDHEYGALYFAGSFREVNGVPSEGIARFGCEDCPPDFNADGTLDTRDIVAFLGAWAAGDDSADFDGDGDIDTIDFVAFLGAWSAGC